MSGWNRTFAVLLTGCSALLGWVALRTPMPPPAAPAATLVRPASQPDPQTRTRVESALAKLPLYFVENRGQDHARVAYYVPGKDTTVYFTPDGVTFALTEPARAPAAAALARPVAFSREPASRRRWSVKLDFIGAKPNVVPRGQDPTPAVVSYFKGSPTDWKTGLKTYGTVVYDDLWPGIDLAYSGTTGKLKYTFLVKPGADPRQIMLAYRGATSVSLEPSGRLTVDTPVGGFSDDKPYAYQDIGGRRVEIPTAYALVDGGHRYGFTVGDYDRTRPLVLDPSVIVYAGYIGGSGADDAWAVAVDAAGNVYVAGQTDSSVPSFPGTVGPGDLTYKGGGGDAFVAKVKADGSGLAYAGYIGGDGFDAATGIAVDSAGNAYVSGYTRSDETSFPVTVGPATSHAGGRNGFVAKVKPDGSGLAYAGYIGDSSSEAHAITVDSAGNAYVTGQTQSALMPLIPASSSLTRPTCVDSGCVDAFVAKVKPDGSGLVYSGYLGGSGFDVGQAIAVDHAGNAYVAGYTLSDQTTFPVKGGPSMTYSGGLTDAFVAKVNANGTGLVYAGYIGGADDDRAYAIAVDPAGAAYVAGYTRSDQQSFPVKVGPDTSYNDDPNGADAFVAKVKPDGTGLIYAGYIGGTDFDAATAIAVDAGGNAYVTGYTSSTETTGFPVKGGPSLTHGPGGGRDAFVAKVKADGSGLVFAGFLGGNGDFESAQGIAVDPAGDIYVVGFTAADQSTFPVTGGPDVTYNGGFGDAFVVKLSGKPDLVEGGFLEAGPNVIPSLVKPGASFLVNDVVANHGLGTARASTTRYYLSLDTSKSTGDILIGSGSVPSLGPGDGFIAGVTVTIPSSTALNSYYVLACADALNAIDELDETNNCKASSHKVTVTLPDLRVTTVTNPRSVIKPGDSFSVTDTVQNFGSISAGASTTRYYFSTDTNRGSDKLLTGSRAVGSLSPGTSSGGTVSITVPTTIADGFYFLLACTDDLNKVSETSETNNCLASTNKAHVARPDLVESAVGGPPPLGKKPGESFSATDTVTNASIVTAGASTTRYYLSLNGTTKSHLLTGTRSVGSLAPDGSSQGTVSVTIPASTPVDSYFLLACADDLKKVDESNETNNCKAAANKITVTQ